METNDRCARNGKKEYSLLTRVTVQKLLIQKVKIEEKHSWEWKSLSGDVFDMSA